MIINSLRSYGFRSFLTEKKEEKNNLALNVSFRAAIPPAKDQYNDLRVFFHHIYEYKKGLRSLVLTTEKASNREIIERRLKRENIPYEIKDVNGKNINVFFGNKDCIRVVSTFDKRLDKLTPEQDFMLGIMLGYDKILQCRRYFVMRDKFFASQKKS
ncbi:MAG: DUF2023 family protein [Clostridium sp.]|nr:DUF2023 family protein [Clostridium sp.]